MKTKKKLDAKYTADQISDWILVNYKGKEKITNLKLQKLLYYCQAWYLAFNNKPLFKDEIQAWLHGPVVPEIYRKFKEFAWNPIEPKEAITPIELDDDSENLVREVLKEYGDVDPKSLEAMTHNEDPWINARKGIRSPHDYWEGEVKCKDMRDYYRSRLAENNGGGRKQDLSGKG